jgi:hypothetical protein
MATATRSEGKSEFVRQVLAGDPYANVRTVNEAWVSTGHEGSISQALVNKLRSEAGLSGNLRFRPKGQAQAAATEKPAPRGKRRGRKPKGTRSETMEATPRRRGRKPRQTTPAADGATPGVQTRGRKSGRSSALADIEADIDRLLFKVMGMGGLTKIEESLRETRRKLYGGFSEQE